MLNSPLGTAGVPPVEAPPAHPAQATMREIEAAREARARERERGVNVQI